MAQNINFEARVAIMEEEFKKTMAAIKPLAKLLPRHSGKPVVVSRCVQLFDSDLCPLDR